MPAISGVGTGFFRWNAGTGQWVKIAQVKSIGGPTMTRAFIDTTTLDTTGGYRTFIAGFRDPGQITLNMNYERDGYEAMKTDFESEEVQNYMIVLPDEDVTSLMFEGLVTELPLNIPTDDVVTADVTIKVTGQVTLESGSQSGSA
jgi:predicted secreted protein